VRSEEFKETTGFKESRNQKENIEYRTRNLEFRRKVKKILNTE